MSAIASTPIDAEAKGAPTSGRLFFLDLSGGRILSANPDGSDLKTIIDEGRKLPDGLVLDVAAGHICWTNMGDPKRNDGSIMRSDLNGKNMITIVPPGGTFTPKQLRLENKTGKLYWSGEHILVPMGYAGDAGKPGRVGNRDSRGYEPGRLAAGIGSEEMVCRHCGGH